VVGRIVFLRRQARRYPVGHARRDAGDGRRGE